MAAPEIHSGGTRYSFRMLAFMSQLLLAAAGEAFAASRHRFWRNEIASSFAADFDSLRSASASIAPIAAQHFFQDLHTTNLSAAYNGW